MFMETTPMRKTPSYLKALAKTCARAAGDVVRLSDIRDEVTAAQGELAACDRLIQKYDARA
jgi:hypothetical protein